MRPVFRLAFGVALAWCLGFGSAMAAPPLVVVSIKPIHSLAASLLEGIAEPLLLVDGAQSPHSFAMRPSSSRALNNADVVVWIGPELVGFLAKSVSVLPDQVRVVSLLHDTPGLERLHLDEDDHDAAHDHHNHGAAGEEDLDPHIWLSPANARAIAAHLADMFSAFGNADRLSANAEALDRQLAELDRTIAQQLAAVSERPFVVLHPAYNYWVKAYGLQQAGVISPNPEQGASASHIADLRQSIAKQSAFCIFAEPQFGNRKVQALAQQLNLRAGILDPLGADIAAGPKAYLAILGAMAAALSDCLAQ